jgi:hypothetical protein
MSCRRRRLVVTALARTPCTTESNAISADIPRTLLFAHIDPVIADGVSLGADAQMSGYLRLGGR